MPVKVTRPNVGEALANVIELIVKFVFVPLPKKFAAEVTLMPVGATRVVTGNEWYI